MAGYTLLPLLPLLLLALASLAGGAWLARRHPGRRRAWWALGALLLGLAAVPLVRPLLLQELLPGRGEWLMGLAFFLPGALAPVMRQGSATRALHTVLLLFFAIWFLSDPLYFALRGEAIRALPHRERDGVVLQSSDATCLPAALATVARLWGLPVTEGEVAYAARTTFQGTRLPLLMRAVETLGAPRRLQARLFHATLDELQRFDLPVILLVQRKRYRHAVVLLGLDATHVVLGEPTVGLLRLERERFRWEYRWDGQVLAIAPDFLHTFHPGAASPRALGLLEGLEGLGFATDEAGIRAFRHEVGLTPEGHLDWRAILVLDALSGPEQRPRLSNRGHL